MSVTHRSRWDLPLDPSLYAPDDEEKAFMKTTTGIQDDEELKAHIFAVQKKAFGVRRIVYALYSDISKAVTVLQVPVHSPVRLHEVRAMIVSANHCQSQEELIKRYISWQTQDSSHACISPFSGAAKTTKGCDFLGRGLRL